MRELITIQKREKLNDVYAVDEQGNGGANHKYLISIDRGLSVPKEVLIEFQKGGRYINGSTQGVIDGDLLEIVRDRLISFQGGAFSSYYNAKALEHLEMALMYMNRRVEDRISRNVLGTDCK